MSRVELDRWERHLDSQIPLLGPLLRRRAIESLDLHREESRVVPSLLKAAQHGDPRIADRAWAALRALEGSAAVDVLCERAIADPQGVAARICLETAKRPSQPDRACELL